LFPFALPQCHVSNESFESDVPSARISVISMSHARARSLRLRRLCLEDTISTFSIAKDFLSGEDRSIQRMGFSDIHEVAADGNRIATMTVDDLCNDLLSSVTLACGSAGGSAHVWLRGRALTSKTWITLRVMTHFAQAALVQLQHIESSTTDSSLPNLLPLPLFIPALKLARSRPSTVESYVRSSHGLDASDELVRFLLEELESKRVMLFIDGLDDITRHRPLVVKYIQDVVLLSHPCVFLTSRGEAIHWLPTAAFSSARIFATDVASFDSQALPVFLEGMTPKQLAAMRYLLSLKFNFPPYDGVTSHSPGQPLIDSVGGFAIASSLVRRDAMPQSNMSLVILWCETYLRELLFAADSRKFVLISSDVDAERGRDQRLMGSPACLSLLESIASLAIQKAIGSVFIGGNHELPRVLFSDEDVSSVIQANPQYGGIWSCLFKSSPVINWGSHPAPSLPKYSFSHPFVLHLVVARATAARLHAGDSIPWLLTRRVLFAREYRGLVFMLAAMLRSESFVNLVSSIPNVVPSYRSSIFLLALAMVAHRPILEQQGSDMKILTSSLKSNGFARNSLSSLILHSSSSCLRSFAIDVIRASDSGAVLSLFVDSLALLQGVSAHALPSNGDATSRSLACIQYLFKFVDEMSSMSADQILDHSRSAVETISAIILDAEQPDCVRLQAVECMFAHLTAALRAAPPSHGFVKCDDRLVFCVTAALSPAASCKETIGQAVNSCIKRTPFLAQIVSMHSLHELACLLIRAGLDDVRLFASVSPEFSCSQSDRRVSAARAAACLCSREDMRSLILSHMRDSSRSVRAAVANALEAFHYDSLSMFEFHNISYCLCISLLLESVPEVVAAFLSMLSIIFPRLRVIPSVAIQAMQQHPAVFDLLSTWISQAQRVFPEASSDTESSLNLVAALGPDFWTCDQLLNEFRMIKCQTPPPSPSIYCKLILVFATPFNFINHSVGTKSLTDCCDHDGLVEVASYLVSAAASVGLPPAPVAPASHSCTCAFIRSCSKQHLIPLFLRVDVPHLFSLIGIGNANFRSFDNCALTAVNSSSSNCYAQQEKFLQKKVPFSLQTYWEHVETHAIVLALDVRPCQTSESIHQGHDQGLCSSTSSNENLYSHDIIRSQLANEFALELVSSVRSCILTLPKDDLLSIAAACRGACAYTHFIITGSSAFEISHDLLCQTLSLVATAGILAINLALEEHNFPVRLQDTIASIFRLASHSSSRVRVAAVLVLSSELTLPSRYGSCDSAISFLDSDHLDSIKHCLMSTLSDDSDAVVSAALSALASASSSDAAFSVALFDAVAASLKETLTFCLAKAEGRSKAAVKVQVLLEFTVSALLSDSPPAIDRIERSCSEIRRICKWFPSSHKPPLCAQPLRLQAIKAASLLISSKRLCRQVYIYTYMYLSVCCLLSYFLNLGQSARNDSSSS